MNGSNLCPTCGAALRPGQAPCAACGSVLAGTVEVASEPNQQQAIVAHGLLANAGLHPLFAYHDDSDSPHPIDPQAPFSEGEGLIGPIITTYGVFVPQDEVEEARRVMQAAERAGAEIDLESGQDD